MTHAVQSRGMGLLPVLVAINRTTAVLLFMAHKRSVGNLSIHAALVAWFRYKHAPLAIESSISLR